jgi:hypothetical protein
MKNPIAILIFISLIIIGTISIEPIKAQTRNVEPLFSKNLFNVELLYAYVQSGARTAVAVVNFTKVSNISLSNYSGVTEVYTVHVFSEGKLVSRNTKIGGIVGSGLAQGDDFINLCMDGSFWASTNVSLETFTIDYRYTDYPILNEPISVSLIRLGWITSQGGQSEINFSSQDQETVKQVELTKCHDGFLYNTLLSQEQLSRLDPFKPLSSYTTTPLSTPTPTVPEFSGLAILPLFFALLFIAIKLRDRRTAKINVPLRTCSKIF